MWSGVEWSGVEREWSVFSEWGFGWGANDTHAHYLTIWDWVGENNLILVN